MLEDIRRIIEKVITHFGSWPSKALIEWTQTPGSPWDMTTKMPGFKWADKIGDGLITDYFESNVIRRRAMADFGFCGYRKSRIAT